MTKKKPKRLLCLVLSLVLIFALNITPAFATDTDTSGVAVVTAETTSEDESDGDSTDTTETVDISWYDTTSTSFTISDAADLAGFAAIVNGTATDDNGDSITADSFSGKTITLTADIDLNSTTLCVASSSSTMFAGTFDGGNYTISNMSCQLFGYISAGATIENVTLNIDSSSTYAGLAGIVYGSEDSVTTISGVTVTGSMTGAAAGLIAYAYSSGTATSGTVKNTEILIENCTNEASITTTNTSGIGGIVNLNNGTSVYFLNCTNKGTLTASVDSSGTSEVHIGGIVRYVNGETAGTYKTTLENCVNTGTITTTQNGSDTRTNVGGMISTAQGGEVEFIDCSNSGTISGTINNSGSGSACVGALAGKWNGYTCTATGFTNTGDITATGSGSSNKAYAGGVVGYTDNGSQDHTIVGATVSGKITATASSSALAGYAIGYISKTNTTTTLAVNYTGTDASLPIVGGMNSSMSDSDITYGIALVYDNAGDYVGYYTTLKTAYAAVANGGTMILVADVADEQLGASSNKAVTLDLNGHIISRSTGSVIDSSKGTLTITDSSETDSAIGTGMIKNTGGTAIKLTGGSVVLESGTLESTSSYAVTLSSGALTVNGGAVIAASSANCIVYYTSGTLTINGGLFTVVDRASDVEESSVTSGAIVNAGSSATTTEDVQVSITGGVFQTYRPLLGTSINLEITGGYFLSKYSLNNYTPEGYSYTSGNSYTYFGVTYSSYYQVAHVNFTLAVTSGDTTETSYYTTLVQAVNAAISAYSSDNSAAITITMENDFETGKVPVESAVVFTLDLNGYTLTSTDKGAFKINSNNAVVTITDNSEAGTGTITTVDSDSVSSSTTGLLQVVNGTLNITGGYYNQNAGSSVFVVSSGGSLEVSGGTFTEDPIFYASSGYAVKTNDDDTFTVVESDVVFNDEEVFMVGHDVVIYSQSGDDNDTNLILAYDDEAYRILYTSDTAARIFGGYLTPTETTTNDDYTITMVSGTVGSLRGGSKGFTSLDNISFNSATINVKGGVVDIIASGWYYNQSADSFTVNVTGGTVTTIYGNGETSYVASQYIQSVIDSMLTTYNDSQKEALASNYYFVEKVTKTVDEVETTYYMYVPTVKTATINVSGGEVTYVYGGGKACTQNGSYTTYTSKDFSMVTNEANITISDDAVVTYVNGGGFSGPEANWGETSGQDTVIVNTANITISGGEIKNLFAGGYNGQWKFTYKMNADGELVFSNYDGTNEDEEVRNIVNTANVTVNDGEITNLFMGGRSYSYVDNSNLTVNGGKIETLSTSGNYGYVENIDADVAGGTITKLELLNRNYVGNIDLDVTGGTVTAFYAGTGGAYKNSNCIEQTYNISTMAILGDVDVNFDGVTPGAAYLTTGLEYAGDVSINVQLKLIAMDLAVSGYTGEKTTSGNFTINNEDTTWTATIYVDGDDVSFDRNGHNEKTLVILPIKLGVSNDSSSSVTAESVVDYGESTMYALVSSDNISSYSTTAYPTTDLTFTDDDGKEHTYIFAGWYEDSEGATACTSIPTTDAYAKFVDSDALSIACVYTPASLSTKDDAALRFISSDYGDTNGLYFIINGTTYTITKDYTSITMSSVSTKFEPSYFSSISQYVFTYGIYSSETSFSVQAGWQTLDGTTVYGTAYSFDANSYTESTSAVILPSTN
ncbi:MAG: hypothetical protein LUG27_01085 [Clostridiales bacterium]|nr:hypothetical protein [Clostridiales bacterium]